jgi:thioredoxin-like negative regulator of GroEL
MLLRAGLAAAALALLVLAVWLWRRPPRRLVRADFLDLAALNLRGPAIVQFSTRACAPCRAATPHLERAARQTELAYAQVDVGDRPEVARAYGIRTVPTIAVAGSDGRLHGVWTALPPAAELAAAARRAREAASIG